MTDGAGTPGVVYSLLPSADVETACSGAGGLDRFLSDGEKTARRRFRTCADSRDYAASHVLLRLLAAQYLGLDARDAADLAITRHCLGCGSADHGRPVLPGVSVSLSRSYGVVMAAVGPAGSRVGVDVERVPHDLFDGFDDFVLAPHDAAAMGDGDVEARMRRWVAKEALLKAAGLGLTVQPSTISLLPVEVGYGSSRAICPEQPLVHGLDIYPVPAVSTHFAAVSTRASGPPIPAELVALPAREDG